MTQARHTCLEFGSQSAVTHSAAMLPSMIIEGAAMEPTRAAWGQQ